jgi:uncharacterized membrane protein YphA (DoxX/SURF4 family)
MTCAIVSAYLQLLAGIMIITGWYIRYVCIGIMLRSKNGSSKGAGSDH